jgi:signal peptidase I
MIMRFFRFWEHPFLGATLHRKMSKLCFFIVNLVIWFSYLIAMRLFQLWDSYESLQTCFYLGIFLLIGQGVTFVLRKNILAGIGYYISAVLLLVIFMATGAIGYVLGNISGSGSGWPLVTKGDLVIGRNFALSFQPGVMVRAEIEGKSSIKRIHGVPGDQITICDGLVYVNDIAYQQVNNWVGFRFENAAQCQREYRKLQLAADEYFVLGDNTNQSRDSRQYGPVPKTVLYENFLYAIRDDMTVRYLTAEFVPPK